MSGETDLSTILSKMQPVLNEGDYVFVSVDHSYPLDISFVHGTFKEKEGTTLILKREKADDLGLKYAYVASCITLNIHSALEAVGFTAAISNTLANNGISCNVVAAFYHDHIFVDKQDANDAMEVLLGLMNLYNQKK
ncbi:ACT domain-containing protein [Flagellimonas sp. S3867]|uniref:ACT domain-containing protein n=1 Tax=Flagellimonas sp. S3867 TaxID=2768063 RepID=UPI0016839393|nr:ACT domain-containing protein [Flagellimonas sp. S3867]